VRCSASTAPAASPFLADPESSTPTDEASGDFKKRTLLQQMGKVHLHLVRQLRSHTLLDDVSPSGLPRPNVDTGAESTE
jgi:hypothetical protein